MKTKKGNILRLVLLILLGIMLGINIYMLNAKSISGNQMPMPFGIGMAVVQSGSMEPNLYKGDLLFVKEKEDISVGDIVVYQSEGILVVHRIVDIDGDIITTRGDANNVSDEPFNREYIKGKVTLRVPAIGYAIDFLKSPLGIVLILAGAILLLELSFRRERKNMQNDKKAQQMQRLIEEIEYLKKKQNSK